MKNKKTGWLSNSNFVFPEITPHILFEKWNKRPLKILINNVVKVELEVFQFYFITFTRSVKYGFKSCLVDEQWRISLK